MAEENQVPEWARKLAEAITSTIEFKGPASIECLHLAPGESGWNVDLVELWPALMEIQEAGPNDGELVFGIVHSFDLLAAQKIFDEVDAVSFGFEDDGQPAITIEGLYKGRQVVVPIYFEPELDDEDEE